MPEQADSDEDGAPTDVTVTAIHSNCTRYALQHNFENGRSFKKILKGYAQVDTLWVVCGCNSQCTAVAALLRDRANTLRKLHLTLRPLHEDWRTLSEHAAREFWESLVGNTHLNDLHIRFWDLLEIDCFDSENLLCDVLTIESICNSNHKLERISFIGDGLSLRHTPEQTTPAKQFLVLNKIGDKDKGYTTK
jgi:hypothetical protein